MADIIDTLYEEHKEPEDESDVPIIEDLVDRFPILHDFLRFSKWKGRTVECPKLGYGLQGGTLYTTLTDVERRRSLRVECRSFSDGISTIENHIMQGAIKSLWYYWPEKGRRNGKKSKG